MEQSDLSHLWSGSAWQDEQIGFIGDDYERLRLRFMSVIRNSDNPFEYFLYGKTSVSGSVCEFQGSLSISETGFYENQPEKMFKHGFIAGEIVLFEDPACLHSGVFRGSFQTDFYLDSTWTFYYNNLSKGSPQYRNNQFEASWYSYTTDDVLSTGWGDGRIPSSGPLDAGYTRFKPAMEYLPNGWATFEQEEKALEAGEVPEPWWK